MIVLEHEYAESQPAISIDTAERISEAKQAFGQLGFQTTLAERQATIAELARAHKLGYLDQLRQLSNSGVQAHLDPELVVHELSWPAAVAASGAMLEAVDRVLAGNQIAWLLSRPGSHHAGPDYGLGFCLINHLAVGMKQALTSGIDRVALIDFDAHHGNGSEDIFRGDNSTLIVSTHQYPFFPGTGGRSQDNCYNFPLEAGNRSAARARERIEQLINDFDPQLIFVEAGVDGHYQDPTSDLAWDQDEFYAWGQAMQSWQRPLICELGGGYQAGSRQEALKSLLKGLNRQAGPDLDHAGNQ